jgi:hypothetical protein
MKIFKFTFVFCISVVSAALSAANLQERDLTEHEFYLLEKYKLTYSKEIFDYCITKHGVYGHMAGNCMSKQDQLKNKILEYAHDRLGRRSLAQSIYDECLDYHPTRGVKRISKCVRTRLVLRSKLGDEAIEKKIYQKCDFKWRKHGASAIDNCSRMEANYYRDQGKLRD